MSSVVVHNSPHIVITRSLSRSTYENFKLLKNLATTRHLKWEERKSYQSRSALVHCRTDLVLMSWLLLRSRCLAKHGDIARVPTSCVRVATSCFDIKPLSHCHEFTHDMRRVSASYNSPHIATNVHELCHKSFGQNCSTSSIRHVHDIHDEVYM